MSEITPHSSQRDSSTSAITSHEATPKVSKAGRKKLESVTLHPLQEKAIRYVNFMLTEEGKPQKASEFLKEAVARHLQLMQKQGIEFPPKMLTELNRLHLIS